MGTTSNVEVFRLIRILERVTRFHTADVHLVIPCLLLNDISMSTSDAFRDAEHIADIITLPATNSGDEEDGASRDCADSAAISVLRDKAYAKAKVVSIDRLLRDLDILIYCELSALYYMEYVLLCSELPSHGFW